MRRHLIVLAALPLLGATPPATLQTYDVPRDKGEQLVIVQTRSFEPGTESGWHVHPGVEIAYVESGEVEMVTAGGVRRLGPGDSILMPRGMAHNGINRGAVAGKVVITLVVDKGAAPRQAVAAP
jgi:quercetin dioxygenase-like cupin family protein